MLHVICHCNYKRTSDIETMLFLHDLCDAVLVSSAQFLLQKHFCPAAFEILEMLRKNTWLRFDSEGECIGTRMQQSISNLPMALQDMNSNAEFSTLGHA